MICVIILEKHWAILLHIKGTSVLHFSFEAGPCTKACVAGSPSERIDFQLHPWDQATPAELFPGHG